ncbi:MAG: hypothetical protein EXR85_03270 [Xanthomonadales bacterium]|nr:hypothetical protein [Xanthomonadales bacterium]
MISRHLVIKIFVALAITVVSFTAYATHSWSNYHWSRTTPSFTLQTLNSTVSAGTGANWPALLSAAASQWSQSTKLDLNVVPYSNALKDRKRCTAVSGKIRVCNAAYGNNGWLGLASINITSVGHITQGTAKMNDSYSSTWAGDANEAPHVMCQEVGHTLGLGHTSEDGSTQNTCMDYSNSPTSTAPNQHDYDQLVTIYGHTTDSSNSYSTSSAATASPGQSGMAGDVPLGNLVHRGHFHDVYVAPDGRGGLWITHVRLAPGFEHLDTQ